MPSLCSEWISTSEASMSKSTGVGPGRRRRTTPDLLRAPRPWPLRSPRLVEGVISWKVRNTVVSEGTEPNRSSWSRRCSMSAQLSPPPASISAVCTSTLPRSCSGDALTAQRDRGRERITESQPVGKSTQERAARRGPRRPPHRVPQRRDRVLVPFTLEVPSWLGCCCVDNNSFPCGGLFRRRAVVSSRGSVNNRG